MQQIHTASGTVYVHDQGRLTRLSEIPIVNAEDLMLNSVPVEWIDEPRVGLPLRYRTEQGPITSTPVTMIRWAS